MLLMFSSQKTSLSTSNAYKVFTIALYSWWVMSATTVILCQCVNYWHEVLVENPNFIKISITYFIQWFKLALNKIKFSHGNLAYLTHLYLDLLIKVAVISSNHAHPRERRKKAINLTWKYKYTTIDGSFRREPQKAFRIKKNACLFFCVRAKLSS